MARRHGCVGVGDSEAARSARLLPERLHNRQAVALAVMQQRILIIDFERRGHWRQPAVTMCEVDGRLVATQSNNSVGVPADHEKPEHIGVAANRCVHVFAPQRWNCPHESRTNPLSVIHVGAVSRASQSELVAMACWRSGRADCLALLYGQSLNKEFLCRLETW